MRTTTTTTELCTHFVNFLLPSGEQVILATLASSKEEAVQVLLARLAATAVVVSVDVKA